MKLSDIIPGETELDFERRVEFFYKVTFTRHERWALFGDNLIVCHPEREPIMIYPNGAREKIRPILDETQQP